MFELGSVNIHNGLYPKASPRVIIKLVPGPFGLKYPKVFISLLHTNCRLLIKGPDEGLRDRVTSCISAPELNAAIGLIIFRYIDKGEESARKLVSSFSDALNICLKITSSSNQRVQVEMIHETEWVKKS